MKYLIFADVHGNAPAMQKVLDYAAANNIDKVLFLGDVVGYNAYPRQCIDLLQQHQIDCVKGNHEGLLLNEIPLFTAAKRARVTLKKTAGLLSAAEKQFLGDMPFSRSYQPGADEQSATGFMMLHGSFRYIDERINSLISATRNFRLLQKSGFKIVFFGHTHKPAIYSADSSLADMKDLKINLQKKRDYQLDDDHYYMINPGSAGESRYELPYTFLVFDSVDRRIHFVEVPWSKSDREALLAKNRDLFGDVHVSKMSKETTRVIKRVIQLRRKIHG